MQLEKASPRVSSEDMSRVPASVLVSAMEMSVWGLKMAVLRWAGVVGMAGVFTDRIWKQVRRLGCVKMSEGLWRQRWRRQM